MSKYLVSSVSAAAAAAAAVTLGAWTSLELDSDGAGEDEELDAADELLPPTLLLLLLTLSSESLSSLRDLFACKIIQKSQQDSDHRGNLVCASARSISHEPQQPSNFCKTPLLILAWTSPKLDSDSDRDEEELDTVHALVKQKCEEQSQQDHG